MDEQNVKDLLEKYNAGHCTDEEKSWLETWYLRHNQEMPHGLSGYHIEQATDRIWARLENQHTKRSIVPFIRYAAAASVILAMGFGSYFLVHKKQPTTQYAQNIKNDIAPGGNKAILTLANGKKITLTGAQNGKLAQQGNTIINKTADGEVSYQAGKENKESEITYNDLYVPKSGQQWVTLPDGTKAMLNSDSHLHFPTAFNGKDRIVELSGEAFFKVAHNVKQPFKVLVNGQTIEDVGTEFNINAYPDEPAVRTTLLEGAVKVSLNHTLGSGVNLKPGEQASLANGKFVLTHPDLDEVMAWRDGMFRFSDQNLDDVMRILARWYNVEVNYADPSLKEIPIRGGIITRFSNVSKVLHMLERTEKMHFQVEGRKITLTKWN